MRLKKFEEELKKLHPDFNIRFRNYGDIAALFWRNEYVLRLSKGELQLKSWRDKNGLRKRGRWAALRMLKNMRWLNENQYRRLVWGIPLSV